MTKIALLGAGGKMGVRLSTNLKDTRFDVDHVEVSEEGRARLKQTLGIECMEQGQAISSADAVVMAVPDRLIGKILKTFVKELRPGAKVVMLDAAAPHAGELPERETSPISSRIRATRPSSMMKPTQRRKPTISAGSTPSSILSAR